MSLFSDQPLDETPHRAPKRRGLIWVYMLSLVTASIAYSLRHWNGEQVERVSQWGLVFLTPALLIFFLQSVRRRLAMMDGGDLLELFPAQRTAAVPHWLRAALLLIAGVLPLAVFALRDGDGIVLMVVAFLGVMLFCIAWLWFDGTPVEARTQGLVVDGIHLTRFNDIEGWEALKRSNVIELHHHGRVTPIYVCPNDRPQLLAFLAANVELKPSPGIEFPPSE